MNFTNNNFFLNFGKFNSIVVAIVGISLSLIFIIAGINGIIMSFKNNDNNDQYNKRNRKNLIDGVFLIFVAIIILLLVFYFVWKTFHSNRFAVISAYDGLYDLLPKN